MVCCCCFPPSAKVLTGSGYVVIGDLKLADKSLALSKGNGRLKETEFYAYLHYDPQLSAEFLVLKCDNGAELIISEKHLLFRMNKSGSGKSKAVQAQDIAIGDRLLFLDEKKIISSPKVMEIGRRTIVGVFAPLTENGKLIVDGFQASCYAEVGSHKLAHAAMAPLRLWYRSLKLVKPGLQKASRLGVNNDGNGKKEKDEIHAYARALTLLRYGVRV